MKNKCPQCGKSYKRIRQCKTGDKMYIHKEIIEGFVTKSCTVKREDEIERKSFEAFAAIYASLE